ncbi:MAG: fumarylacetoacetate hydrolase family protein [Candidatus Eisenbacteria bacterium]|nr:fumarylacetoacetate hydrolase family protein [Candidatus Eisenbacteria bacterium]
MGSVRIEGIGDEIAVGTIFCLGRNYREHALEMGSDVPTEPIVFLKPSTALLEVGEPIILPGFSRDIHHEVEMVVLLGREGRDIVPSDAMEHVVGYGVGLDLTARDVQAMAKSKGLPWAVAKGFDGSAPVSRFIRAADVPDPHALELSLLLNGTVRQSANTAQMIFRVDDTIAWLSTIFTLMPGDLIFTGTPEGVGPIVPGDEIEIRLDTLVSARFTVGGQ